MSKVYESLVVEVLKNGDGLIDLPEEMTKELGWEINDTLNFTVENDSIIIKNLSLDLRDKGALVFSNVAKFMIAAGQTVVSHNPVQAALYEKLIDEEYGEFKEAIMAKDEVEQVDACFDMIWVIIGYMLSKGWNCPAIWKEGAASNLAKIDPETGLVLKREDGKVLKPEGWQPPNFSKFATKN
jgi:predicted HAD superfamily Cof-like phosphohydrolase